MSFMSRRFPRQFVVLLVAGAGLAYLGSARAGVLYKCDSADGSIAYTSSRQGYTNCTTLSVFADPPKHASTAMPQSQSPEAAGKPGWVYQENVKEPARADFSNVAFAVASWPVGVERISFAVVTGAAQSTALQPAVQDFSNVQPGVTSDALMIGLPLYIAAPYRQTGIHMAPSSIPATPADVSTEALPFIPAAATVPTRPRVLRGAVYKVARTNGITEYTNIRPRGASFAVLFTYIATCVACDIHSTIDFARTALNLDAYKDDIAAAAADYGVDRSLLRAVIHAESAFNPMALSNKGAQGLMQLMPDTADDLGVTDAFDTSQNIRAGARYLAQLLKSFNGNTQLATAAYNAGPGAVMKYRGVPPYQETQVYVQRVETLRDRYKKAM